MDPQGRYQELKLLLDGVRTKVAQLQGRREEIEKQRAALYAELAGRGIDVKNLVSEKVRIETELQKELDEFERSLQAVQMQITNQQEKAK